MALKAIIETLDDVPDPFREHYVERTDDQGKKSYILGVDAVGGYSLDDVSGLKTALGAERGVTEKMRQELARFGSAWDKDKKTWTHSLDPEKAREAIARLEEIGSFDPEKEADKIAKARVDAATQQLVQKHGEEIKAKEARERALVNTVDELLRQQKATAALAEAGGSVELLLPHVLKYTRTVEGDGGKFRVEVIDGDGNVRIADASGTPMDIGGLVKEMRDSSTFGRAFDGEGASGSGKQPDNADKGGASPKGAPLGAQKFTGDARFGGTPEERRAAISKKFNLKE